MAREYNVMPNIRQARITENTGEMVLELEGEEKDLDAGLQSLKDQGIGIEFIVGDVVE